MFSKGFFFFFFFFKSLDNPELLPISVNGLILHRPNINLNISISFIDKMLAVIVKILKILVYEIQCLLEQQKIIWGSRIISSTLKHEAGASRKSWATFAPTVNCDCRECDSTDPHCFLC